MRIVAGRFKGRTLKGPTGPGVRPTSDRLRETIFNILAHAYDDPVEGARVIDLFAGTGALGIEAISRGARHALFVDDSAEGRALIRENVDRFGLGGETGIFRRNATRLGAMPPQEPFSIAFLDPPYGRSLAPPALLSLRDGGWLAPDAICIIEEIVQADLALPEGFTVLEARDYGETRLTFVRFA